MMPLLDVGSLVAMGLKPTQARLFSAALTAACARFDIVTPARIAAFIAQCRVESRDFSDLEEDLYYTTPERLLQIFPSRVTSLQQAQALVRNPQALANAVYAGRNGNGNPVTGDGWRYRGRGLIQLTGRGNYRDAEVGLGRPFVAEPDLLLQAADACLTAAWYWHTRKCNLLADAWLIDDITRQVNGPARAHADLRRQYSERAVRALQAA